MLQKFEAKSQRVKGIAFHSIRPWSLTSLHSGQIQLWDYRLGTLIDVFEEHDGPVRGIDFHSTQPLFISGGDDFKIKVWNYKLKRCIITLLGHMDYIRTVFFHPELPWILSASDDQTIRIWNWTQLAMLTGHGHYVMCAQFHPNKDLIISASLDQTLRLWDYSALKKKYSSSGVNKNQQLSYEIEVRQILEGHDRGVNWCCFHPTQNIILSAADDRKIKIWRYTDIKAWEHDTLYGHTNNVSCVLYHPKLNVIVSNSEDKTIKIWDMEKKTLIDTIKKENERFWILSAHPNINILGAGSDAGSLFFNLARERIHFVIQGNNIYFIYKNNLKQYNVISKQECVLKEIHIEAQNLLDYSIRSLKINTFEQGKLIFLVEIDNKEVHMKKIEIYQFEGDADNFRLKEIKNDRDIYGIQGVFISKGKIAYLEHDNKLKIYEYQNSQNKKEITNIPDVQKLFAAPLGKILLKIEFSLILFDLTSNIVLNQYQYDTLKIKSVVWNENNSYVAMACKKTILIFNKQLQKICSIQEKINVKSLIWNSDNIVFYSTVNHVKYLLLNGDSGIVKCLENPIYLIQIINTNIDYIDRDGKIESFQIKNYDSQFKLALLNRDQQKINQILDSKQIMGNSLVSYLYQKNYSGIALNLVQDPKAKFSLAIDSGNLEVAFKQCQLLKDVECFKQLGEEAMRQGNHHIVEICYQNQKSFEKLSFLYALTGNQQKLEKMLQISHKRGDIMSRFHNSLYLGDIQERIRILAEIVPLAYMSAVVHNLPEMAEPLKQSLEENFKDIKFDFESVCLLPPKPVFNQNNPIIYNNWPHNKIQEEEILILQQAQEQKDNVQEYIEQDDFDNLDNNNLNQEKEDEKKDEYKDITDNNWEIDELDLPEMKIEEEQKVEIEMQDNIVNKFQNSIYPGEQAAIGNFQKAFNLLNKQIGAVNFLPFKQIMVDIYMGQKMYSSSAPFCQEIQTNISYKKPNVYVNIQNLYNQLQQAQKCISDYKLQDGLEKINQILLSIPLISSIEQNEKQDLIDLLKSCLDYSLAINFELEKTKNNGNQQRQLELASYMCVCQVDMSHRILFLKNTMGLAYKLKCFIYSSYFAKKIIQILESQEDLKAKDDTLVKAKRVYQACEQQSSNAFKINFEERMLNDSEATSKICASTFQIIREYKQCPFCNASFSKKVEQEICNICGVAKIGQDTMGLKVLQ